MSLCLSHLPLSAEFLPRKIIALYDRENEISSKFSKGARFAEMPLNHLGLEVFFYDVQKPLPKIADDESVRGVLAWLPEGITLDDPAKYVLWCIEAMEAGKKLVSMGGVPIYESRSGQPTPKGLIEKYWSLLGLRDTFDWEEFTYNSIFKDRNTEIIGFEYLPILPEKSFYVLHADSNKTEQLWTVIDPKFKSPIVLASLNENGAYVASGYAVYMKDEAEEFRKWIINPFLFFRKAYETLSLPKPDASTLANRRIYYSHIDGDGWNNYTQVQTYRAPRKPTISAQVIYDLAISEFPDLPVTVTAIAADLDPKWAARKESGEVAKKLFHLPHVEMGTHTYSHPFNWDFFKEGDPEKEIPFLKFYPGSTWQSSAVYAWMKDKLQEERKYDPDKLVDKHSKSYRTPRAFAKEPFSIEKEIIGSAEFINQFAPSGKKVEIVMWSGNTSPFKRALELALENNLLNINGGDARFDKEYPSLAWVSPLGRKAGGYQQVFASNSNENTYTDLWTGRFHGFSFLLRTIENTETPIRLKPFNVYYHMYSGEKQAALNALLDNLNYARSQKLIPIKTSRFSRIVNGFFTTKIDKIGKDRWRFLDRGALQTIRFDKSSMRAVDFSRSSGVIGQKHYQGSLYVYLDEAFKKPIISLKKDTEYWHEPNSTSPYLVESRWRIWNLERNQKSIKFTTAGYGKGEMLWKLPYQSIRLVVKRNKEILLDRNETQNKDGMFEFEIPLNALEPLSVVFHAT